MIDYTVIAAGLTYFRRRGYELIDVPWTVSKEAYDLTRPATPARDLHLVPWDSYLAASGEQCFIDMLLQGHAPTRAMCVTPCFRDEEREDELHHRHFLKIELIVVVSEPEPPPEEIALQLLVDAQRFFAGYVTTAIVQTSPTSWDLVGKRTGIELGSYGFRTHGPWTWCYGTGVAEPRLSTVMQKESVS